MFIAIAIAALTFPIGCMLGQFTARGCIRLYDLTR